MNLTTRDATRSLAGRTHAAVYPNRKRSARLNGHSLGTDYRWTEVGPPALTRYIENAEDPWRLAAHMRVRANAETIQKRSTLENVRRYRALRYEVTLAYAEILKLDDSGASQVERAAADENLSALAAERAAIRLALSHMSDSDIWGLT